RCVTLGGDPLPEPGAAMPRFCTSCKYVTDDVWADGCPICLRPLALAPQVPAAPGRAGPVRGPRRRRPLRRLLGVLLVAAPVTFLVLVFLVPTVFLGPEKDADSTGRIRAGMFVGEVARELKADPPPRAFTGFVTWGEGARLVR